MAKVIALYKKPTDPAAFDSHYWSTHMPLAKTMPGLRKYEVSTGPIGTPSGEASLYMVGILSRPCRIRQSAAINDAGRLANGGRCGDRANSIAFVRTGMTCSKQVRHATTADKAKKRVLSR